MLQDVHVSAEFTSFEEPIDGGNPTLLQQVQSGLLQGELGAQDSVADSDDSLTIISAH